VLSKFKNFQLKVLNFQFFSITYSHVPLNKTKKNYMKISSYFLVNHQGQILFDISFHYYILTNTKPRNVACYRWVTHDPHQVKGGGCNFPLLKLTSFFFFCQRRWHRISTSAAAPKKSRERESGFSL
jgi:hypothetical protein